MPVRGIRGATTISKDTSEQVLKETKDLFLEIMKKNPTLETKDVSSVIFSATDDIQSQYPARAARELGWVDVPLLCVQEMHIEGSMRSVIRLLIHWNTDLQQASVHHVYLKDAQKLRPDLIREE